MSGTPARVDVRQTLKAVDEQQQQVTGQVHCCPSCGHTLNGQAERFILTMLAGWAHGAIYRDSNDRTAALAGWIDFYNRCRPQGALSHKPP